MSAPRWIGSWVLGALSWITVLSVMSRGPIALWFALAVLVVLVLRSHERAAFGGGALVPTGAWFLYALRGAVERCAEIDRSPAGSCAIHGVEEQAVAMALYLAVGVGLTLYAASRHRPRASVDPSAAAPTRL